MDLATWLRELGLERYEGAFRDNEIDAEILPTLTADDLNDLGVTVVGHRRKLLNAIEALSASPESELAPAPSATAETLPQRTEAERRRLTVMFVDLVGSTALSAKLDPEDLREVVGAYHRCVADAVAKFDGFVAKYMGDGVLIYFGYPQAHEDDAERAVRAGLQVAADVPALKPLPDSVLAVRVGIATGLAVVGDLIGSGAAQEQAVVGQTPNIAARLQAIAQPGSVVIAASTSGLLGSLFELRDVGAVEAKGFAAPVPAWQVLGESSIESRFEAFHPAGLSPLVGRKEEIELLRRRWRRAQGGEGQVVLLSAEPGVGKSRLVAALQERLEAHTQLRYFCSSHHEDSALYPIISQLKRAAGFDRDDAPGAKLGKLEVLLGDAPTAREDLPLLAELLSLPTDRSRPAALSPQVKKERTLRGLVRQLEHLSRRAPVLMLFEDLHWIDPTSLELLHLTVERVEHLPVLLLVTYRPEFQPPWTGQPHVVSVSLCRLSRKDTAALIARVAGDKLPSAEIVEEIVERTDGVPLFVEELTKAVLETAPGEDAPKAALSRSSLAALGVPATLHASLMARLDRLGPPAKHVAQIGAVIGREFSYEHLDIMARLSAPKLQEALNHLVGSGLIAQRRAVPDAIYAFKHALVQDAAYGTLLRGRRQELHARVARMLEDGFPDVGVTQPELLARHCAEGGLAEQAVDYWFAAAERALRAGASIEAIEHLTQGLGLLTSALPETPERDRKELRFQTTLGPAFLATRGWAASEAAQAYRRADELCRSLGDDGERFKILLGLFFFHQTRGESDRARTLSDELFRLAEQQDDDDLRLQAHHAAWNRTWLGEFAISREHIEQGLARYSQAKHRAHALTYAGHDPAVCGWAQGGLDLWFLGYPERAAESVRRSVLLAEELAHPPTLAHGLNYGMLCHQLRRDEAAVGAWRDRLAAVAAEHRFALFEATAILARGWVLANQGRARSSVAELRRGLAGCLEVGALLFQPYYHALLAQAHLDLGEAPVGLELVEDAMGFADRSGVRFWDAELWRLKGKLLAGLSPSKLQDAEACYLEALAVSRTQQARSLELRAASSLAALWGRQGRRSDACDLLAPIYGWFAEGFETADLKEAKALLDELS